MMRGGKRQVKNNPVHLPQFFSNQKLSCILIQILPFHTKPLIRNICDHAQSRTMTMVRVGR